MRQAAEEILNGKFHTGNGSLDFSCPRIELSLHADEVVEDFFGVYGPEGQVTEGRVLSTDLRMECLTRTFSGSEDEIHYRFDSHGMEEGEEVRGAFHMISNRGEYYLPFTVSVAAPAVVSSMGSVKNLFHFTNLAKSSWDEAVRLFYSEEFRTVLSGSDRKFYAAYKGLSAVPGNEHNVEEFLIEINKKKPVEFLPEETSVRIENPEESARYALVVNRNGWGYTRLRVETEGGFLRVEQNTVLDADFLGNIYRVYYYVDLEKLHGGSNYGCIVLSQEHTSVRIPVTVVLHAGGHKALGIHREKNRLTVELMEYYQSFRLKKIGTKTWMTETDKVLAGLTELDGKETVYQLFRAQLLLTEERYNEAKWMIEKQEAQAMAAQREQPELWCYYLYLTTLYSRDERYVDEAAAEVAEVYQQNRGNWRIAWLMMYLSEEYVRNPARRWELLEELFRYRCRSPVIYVEAWNLLCANPSMLLKLDEMEIQVLRYAVKKGLMQEELVMQTVYLAQKMKNYSDSVFAILQGFYEMQPKSDILHAICTLLIKGSRCGADYFKWYRAGVEQNLRITRLYEYYMMSLPPQYDGPLPKAVLLYFAYQSDLSYEITAYLYAYVHRHRETMTDVYVSYHAAMERFVTEQIRRERINPDLAYLYRHLVSLTMIDEETARHLAALLFRREVTVDNERIDRLFLVYPHGVGEECYPLADGRAQVSVYDSDCRILLGDAEGNRYTATVEYGVQQLISPAKLALMIAPFVRDDPGYAVYICFEYQNTFAVQDDNADLFALLAASDRVEEPLRREIRMMLVRFYYEKDKMRELDDYLLELTPQDVSRHDRKEIIRYMIVRGMYEEAYAWVCRFGPYGVDAKMLVKLCSRLLDQEDFPEDETMTGILCYVVRKGKYDENVLQYLIRHFNGSLKEMRDIWKIADDFRMDTRELCERMIIQMLYTGAHVGEKMDIFRAYVQSGGNETLVSAFAAQCCYDHVIGGQIIEPYLFAVVRQQYREDAPVPLVCKIAFLRYYAENKEEQDEGIRAVCCDFLTELTDQGVVLEVYKEYQGYIPQMDEYQDKTIVEYHAGPGARAVIHYVIQTDGGGEAQYRREEMRDVFAGLCVKEFILFFGERLQYYITEETAGGEQLTLSGAVNRSEIGQESTGSRFSVLNDIMIGMTMHDYNTVDGLMREYYVCDYMTREIFRMR